MARKKGIPRLRIKARIASKVMEKDLIEKAKMLMDDPELILPDCAGDCRSCPFKKTRARLLKIQRFKDDPAKLAKFARGGDKLARAYAATISLVHEEKTPYLATAQYPVGTVAYALRGKTDREKLIGVQYFDSPKWRVLSVRDLVNRKGLHFYSYGDDFVCTGREPKPPQEYVKIAAESVGASRLDSKTYSCPHSPAATNHIEFDWVTAGSKILVCDQCAVKSKNTLVKLAEGMAVPRVLNEFDISVVRSLENVGGKGECDDFFNRPLDRALLDKYSAGQVGDKELIEEHMRSAKVALGGISRRAYVKGDRFYGDDVVAYVNDLTEDEVERKALLGLLKDISHPIFVEQGESVNGLMSMFWSAHGEDALRAVVPPEIAKKHYKDDEESIRSPLRTVRQAVKEAEHSAVAAMIPKYRQMSPYAEFVDQVARAYKTEGAGAAVAVLDADKSADHRVRSIAHGMYLALGITTKSWKFTDEEKEYGKHLQTAARELLESKDPEKHHEAFVTMLREAGCTEDVKRVS